MRVMRTLFVIAATALIGGCAFIEQSSVSSGPRPDRGNRASSDPAVSQSGRFVAFTSTADNLVPGDTNGVSDVFVHDHVTNTTELISVATNGAQGDGGSDHPSISDDGRYVAFQTDALNFGELTHGEFELRGHAYVRDRQLGTTKRVDTALTAQTELSALPTISGNGRFVAYVVLQVDGSEQLFRFGPYVRNLVTGTTTAMPNPALEGSWVFHENGPSLSDDGSRVAYSFFDAGSPSRPDGFYRYQSLVADTATATTDAVVYEKLIPEGATSGPRIEQTISGDGTKVALAETVDGTTTISSYDLAAPGLVPRLTGIPDARGLALSDDGSVLGFRRSSQYLVSTNGGTPRVVSADREGRPVSATDGDLSGDGRWVAFSSADLRLSRDDPTGVDDVFLHSTHPTRFARPS